MGKVAYPLGTLYHGTKFAVEGLSEALSYELASVGVKVKIVEPGFIRTDFGSRSFDFTNDESLTEYQPVVAKLMEGFQSTEERVGPPSEPEVVSEVIFTAATDGTAQLRYTAGEDAKQMMATRKSVDDATWMNGMRVAVRPRADGGLEAEWLSSSTPSTRRGAPSSGIWVQGRPTFSVAPACPRIC